MARFDYHRTENGYLLDCQADLLNHLRTRLVVPLMHLPDAPQPAARLNPILVIAGVEHVMVTQFAAAVLSKTLGETQGSLASHDRTIMDALDMLLTGY